jgi:hypothetical protein
MSEPKISRYTAAEWTDASAYPPREGTRMRRWAWEFLRRNPEYQMDYERWIRNAPQRWPGPEKDLKWYQCDPPALPGETYAKYERRLERAKITERKFKPLNLVLREKYHIALNYIPAPEDDDPPSFTTNMTGPFLFGPQREVHWHDGLAAEQAIYVFDLAGSLEAQCERALQIMQVRRDQLVKSRPELRDRRARTDRFQDYLRVLDAFAAGARAKDIASVLFPNLLDDASTGYGMSQNVRNYRKAAIELRDGGYRFLPFSEATRKSALNK